MKTIELNLSERLYGLIILNGFKGNLDVLSTILDDIKQFPISDEEWSTGERVIEKDTWRWDDEKGVKKVINLNKETSKYIVDTIKEKSDKGELTMNDKAALTLKKKLE